AARTRPKRQPQPRRRQLVHCTSCWWRKGSARCAGRLSASTDSPCMTNVIGEDRSSFQPVSSWSGDYFGIAKAAEGTGWQDPTFAANWANLKAAGIPRGAYHFFHPADDPVQQADFAWDVVQAQGWEDGDFIVADVEILSGVGGAEDYGTARAAARAHTGLRAAAAPHLQQVSLGALTLEFLQRLSAHAGPQHRVLLYTDL